MAWYWIVLLIIGYFVIGSILGKIFGEDEEEFIVAIVLFWPLLGSIALPIGIVWGIYIIIDWLIDAISNQTKF